MTYPDNPNGEVLTYTYDSGGIVNGVMPRADGPHRHGAKSALSPTRVFQRREVLCKHPG